MLSRKRVLSLMVFGLLIGMLVLSVSGVSAELKPYEIKWYYIGNGPARDTEMVEQKVNEYLKDKINATIKLQNIDWGSYNNKMQVIIASGEPFDICFTCSWTNNYRQNVAKGAFVDITDLVQQYAPNAWKQLHPGFIKGSAIDGRNYAIPTNKELAHQWGFLLRKDIVQKYNFNLSKIKKFSDIEPLLKVVKEKEPEMIPLQAIVNESGLKALDFDRIGDDKIPGCLYNDSKDMKVFNELTRPETKAYFKTIRKFYLAGYIPKDAATMTNFNEARRAGKVFASINSLKPLGDEETSKNMGIPWIQVPLTNPVVQTRDATGSMQAISITSKDLARALMFLELFNTDKYLNNLINYGIEGVHYIKKGDNIIALPNGITPQNSGYRPGIQWVLGNQYLNYFWEGSNTTKWDLFKKFNDSATNAKSIGFNFDAEPVKTEIAACINVWNEYIPALETGTVDPDKVLPQALAKFKAAGVDKVIAEKQKQLNAWLAKTKK